MRTWMSAVAVLALAGCGDGIGGEVRGSIGGQGLEVRDAVFMAVPAGPGVRLQYVALANQDDLCPLLSDPNTTPPEGLAVLDFYMLNISADGNILDAQEGTYSVTPTLDDSTAGRAALSSLVRTRQDATGIVVEQGLATDGAIELSKTELGEDSGAEGRFDVLFGTDRVEGDFKARYCEVPGSYFFGALGALPVAAPR